jgi:hypothetical protein
MLMFCFPYDISGNVSDYRIAVVLSVTNVF